MPEGAPAKRSLRHLVGALRSQLQTSWFLSATPNACAGSGECACARMCEVWIVADCCCCCCGPVCSVCSAALACDARVLCACACWMRVRVCVCCARAAGVCCVLYSAVRPVCEALRRRPGWQGCAVGCGALRVVARLPDGVRRPRSPPDRVVGGPGRGHAVCAACEAVCAAGAQVSVRRGTRVCVHAAGAGGRGGRRGLTAVRRPLVFCVTRVGAQRGLAAIALPRRKKRVVRVGPPN